MCLSGIGCKVSSPLDEFDMQCTHARHTSCNMLGSFRGLRLLRADPKSLGTSGIEGFICKPRRDMISKVKRCSFALKMTIAGYYCAATCEICLDSGLS